MNNSHEAKPVNCPYFDITFKLTTIFLLLIIINLHAPYTLLPWAIITPNKTAESYMLDP
jgi:hypothetical protein